MIIITAFRNDFRSFDYDYEDIYDDDYWDDLDTTTTDSSVPANNTETQDSNGSVQNNRRRRRRKRSTTTEKSNRTKTTLKRTNSASSVLGLNILLYQDRDDYFGDGGAGEIGVVSNNYYGFKVLIYFKHSLYAYYLNLTFKHFSEIQQLKHFLRLGSCS